MKKSLLILLALFSFVVFDTIKPIDAIKLKQVLNNHLLISTIPFILFPEKCNNFLKQLYLWLVKSRYIHSQINCVPCTQAGRNCDIEHIMYDQNLPFAEIIYKGLDIVLLFSLCISSLYLTAALINHNSFVKKNIYLLAILRIAYAFKAYQDRINAFRQLRQQNDTQGNAPSASN